MVGMTTGGDEGSLGLVRHISRSRSSRTVGAAGSGTTPGLLRGSRACEGGTGHWSLVATMRELEDELVRGVRENRFTCRRDWGLVVEGNSADSNSEGPDWDGGMVSTPRVAGMSPLRGKVVDRCVAVCDIDDPWELREAALCFATSVVDTFPKSGTQARLMWTFVFVVE